MNRTALTAAAVAIIAVAILAGLIYLTDRPSLRGSVIDPPLPAAEISLTDVDGRPFGLSDVRGNVALIYFGFTHCPDECPLTMANLKLAVDMLGSGADRTTVILVTTDPERDTPEAIRDFLGRFNTAFLGLTGTPDQLTIAWKDYGVTVMDGGETHSNYIYVIDTSGNLVETFLPDARPADIAADIRTLLDEN
ncbi:MAG: SCO family protein [Chloroflexota bacterium]